MALRFMKRLDALSSENHDTDVICVGAIFLTISSLGIAARLVSHRIKKRRLQIDDILLLWAHVRRVAHLFFGYISDRS